MIRLLLLLLLTCGCGVGQTDKSVLHCGGDIGSCKATTPERAQQPKPVRHKKHAEQPVYDCPEGWVCGHSQPTPEEAHQDKDNQDIMPLESHYTGDAVQAQNQQIYWNTGIPEEESLAQKSIDSYVLSTYYQDLHPTDAENGHPGWLLYVGYGMAGGANPEQKACRKDGYAHSMIWGVEYVQKCYGNDVIGVLLPLYGDCSEASDVSYIHPITGEVVLCRSELMFGEPDQSIPIVTHESVRDVKSCLDGRHLEIYSYFPDGRVGYQSVATPYPARGAFRVPNENHIDKCVKDVRGDDWGGGDKENSVLENPHTEDRAYTCQQCAMWNGSDDSTITEFHPKNITEEEMRRFLGPCDWDHDPAVQKACDDLLKAWKFSAFNPKWPAMKIDTNDGEQFTCSACEQTSPSSPSTNPELQHACAVQSDAAQFNLCLKNQQQPKKCEITGEYMVDCGEGK